MMPIVFAVRNTDLATPLALGLSYTIYDSTWNDTTGDILKPNWANIYSSDDPYFVITSTEKFSNVEGRYKLLWGVHAFNCSRPGGMLSFDAYCINDSRGIWFTTKKGGQTTDLVAATDPNVCGVHSSLTYNVTNTLEIPPSSDFYSFGTCAVLSPTSPWPTPSPCEVQISPAKVSSIKAAGTADACKALEPVVSCPAETNHAAGSFRIEESSWLVVAFGWLACVFRLF